MKLDDLEWYEIDDEQDLEFAEKNIKIAHKRHTYHTAVKNMLKSPFVCYRNERYLGNNKVINKKDAAYLLNTLSRVFKDNGIDLMLAYGTLLGAIREGDFIGHDCDMDTMIWHDNMQLGLDLAPQLERYGINLYCYVLPWIFTYKYNDVTCDIDVIWDAESPFKKRYCLLESQHIPRSFFENTTTIDFVGAKHIIPSDTEKLLVYHYGNNWRVPGKGHARLESKLFFWIYLEKFTRKCIRFIKKKFIVKT